MPWYPWPTKTSFNILVEENLNEFLDFFHKVDWQNHQPGKVPALFKIHKPSNSKGQRGYVVNPTNPLQQAQKHFQKNWSLLKQVRNRMDKSIAEALPQIFTSKDPGLREGCKWFHNLDSVLEIPLKPKISGVDQQRIKQILNRASKLSQQSEDFYFCHFDTVQRIRERLRDKARKQQRKLNPSQWLSRGYQFDIQPEVRHGLLILSLEKVKFRELKSVIELYAPQFYYAIQAIQIIHRHFDIKPNPSFSIEPYWLASQLGIIRGS